MTGQAHSDGDQEEYDQRAKWTLPKRSRIDGNQNLHISSFNIVRDGDYVAFLRASERYPVGFKRGKLLLPAAIVDFGENPREVATRVLNEQLTADEMPRPKFVSMQSYMGAHWDLVLIFEALLPHGRDHISFRGPFNELRFHKLDETLPRSEIAEDHLEVIEAFLKDSSA